MRFLGITFVFCLLSNVTFAQASNDQIKEDILYYADIVANAMDPVHKMRANDELVQLVDKALEQKIDLNFDEIKWISNISPQDSSFQIISWPVMNQDGLHDYHAYIIEEDKYTKLEDKAESMMEDIEYMLGDASLWFGQLYYEILSFEQGDETMYLLFGINAFDQFENIKIAEVLRFDANRKVSFGHPVFADSLSVTNRAKNRIFLKYSQDSNVSLNYNPAIGSIVYEHLIPMMGQMPGQGMTNIADGSYEGYELKEGYWIYKDKLFDHIYEEAPRPNPVLDVKEKDIFGKDKNR